MKKLLAAPALQFKGSGFYITDYSNKGKDQTEKATSGSKPEASTTPAPQPATSETKTEKKTEKNTDSSASTPAPPPKSDGNGKT